MTCPKAADSSGISIDSVIRPLKMETSVGHQMFFPVMHISRDLYNKNYNDINNKIILLTIKNLLSVPGPVLVNLHDLFKAHHNQVK